MSTTCDEISGQSDSQLTILTLFSSSCGIANGVNADCPNGHDPVCYIKGKMNTKHYTHFSKVS